MLKIAVTIEWQSIWSPQLGHSILDINLPLLRCKEIKTGGFLSPLSLNLKKKASLKIIHTLYISSMFIVQFIVLIYSQIFVVFITINFRTLSSSQKNTSCPFSYHDPVRPSPKQSASMAVSLYLPIVLHHSSGVVLCGLVWLASFT